MDTKWKKRKTAVSFGIFFLSISLLLASGAVFLRESLETGSFQKTVSKVVERDYQNTASFRRFIQSRMSNFFAMATGGSIGGYFDDEGFYYEEMSFYDQYQNAVFTESGNYRVLTEADRERRKAKNTAQAKAFHEEIRRDKNLLYRIADSGRELYANMDGIAWDAGSNTLPKGYNFRLDFNGENVSIYKDGRKQDIYGDGYYRGQSQWYVPGYQNFSADEDLKSVNITIFAAADPVSYSYAGYGADGFMQTGNRLYDIAQEVAIEHNSMSRAAAAMAAGAALFAVYLYLRKEKRAADRRIAQLTGRIWFEAKLALLLLAAGMCGLPGFAARSLSGILISQVQDEAVTESVQGFPQLQAAEYEEYGIDSSAGANEYPEYGIDSPAGSDDFTLSQEQYGTDEVTEMEELGEAFAGPSSDTDDFYLQWVEASVRWKEFLSNICSHPVLILVCFWAVYLFANDVSKNRRRALDGLFRRLIQRARTDTLKQPFAVQQMRRVLLPAFAGILAVLAQMAVTGILFTGFFNRTEAVCAQILVLVALLAVLSRCLADTKRRAQELDLLADQIRAVQDGDYTEKETLSEDSGLKPLSESLSKIRRGMEAAVGEQLKSERMKVELVTNVSHDLKTPLTSIISYLAFLKQETGLPEHVQDYIRILDQKAGRLNSMVQDVFAISKAACGQLPVEVKELDFAKLLRQTLADMQEKIQGAAAVLKAEIPQEAVMIQADGTRLYRVFQNLIQNALQYSLEGSRIFVELKQEDGYAAASIKNISRQELRAGTDVTERFVRGDESRTDGGSGLGLSIAKSFTEACGGTFALETDADLFAVKVCFPVSGDLIAARGCE